MEMTVTREAMMSDERINTIRRTLNPRSVITDETIASVRDDITTRDAAITAEEIIIVREAARQIANTLWPSPESQSAYDARLATLGVMWRELVSRLDPAYAGKRLVDTYAEMYPALEAEGGIDGWAGSESKSVLANLVCMFPTDAQRWSAVRETLDVAQWNMGAPAVHPRA
jgi:hypothetical protein